MVGHASAEDQGKEEAVTLALPREEIRPAWRAAVQAYRREHRATCDDLLARTAAYAAFRKVLPDMPEEQAKVETAHAIAYAATHHAEWFWGRPHE